MGFVKDRDMDASKTHANNAPCYTHTHTYMMNLVQMLIQAHSMPNQIGININAHRTLTTKCENDNDKKKRINDIKILKNLFLASSYPNIHFKLSD